MRTSTRCLFNLRPSSRACRPRLLQHQPTTCSQRTYTPRFYSAASGSVKGNRVGLPAEMAQPTWHAPPEPSAAVRERLPKLSVYNSLRKAKDAEGRAVKTPFVPLDPEGKKVGWYACGPTVYDDAVCLCFKRRANSGSRWLMCSVALGSRSQLCLNRHYPAYTY